MPLDLLTRFGTQALASALLASAPALAASLIIGIAVATFGAATQIQDPAVSHVPRAIGVGVVVWASFAYMSQVLVTYTQSVLEALADLF